MKRGEGSGCCEAALGSCWPSKERTGKEEHLLLDHNWLRITKTTERETADKGVLLYAGLNKIYSSYLFLFTLFNMPTRSLKLYIWLIICSSHCIPFREHCRRKRNSMNTGKGETESSLFAYDCQSDKKSKRIIWKLCNQRQNSLRHLDTR